MKVRAIKAFISAKLGNVDSGQVLDVSPAYADHLVENKLCTVIDAAPATPARPEPAASDSKKDTAAGPDTTDRQSGSASQAAQASQKKTSKPSTGGSKKKKGGK